MPSLVEWSTDEELRPSLPPSPDQEPRPARQRGWLLLAVGLLLLAVVGYQVLRDVDQQITTTESSVREDVLAAHRLWRDVAARRDIELLQASISGRDASWTLAQEILVRVGMVWDRTTVGLVPAAAEAPPATAVLSPDLSSAEVTYDLPYRAGEATVWLRHTAVYRRGDARWLLSPPDDAFWGEWETAHGRYLDASYSTRDSAVASRLVADLDALIDRACQLPDLDCHSAPRLTLQFSRDPLQLIQLREMDTDASRQGALFLPAPTLLGLPQDEPGYQAVRAAYGRRVVATVVADLVEYDCCEHGPFFLALLDVQLDALGLQPWPMGPADFEQLLQEDVQVNMLSNAWRRNRLAMRPAESRLLHALVSYVLTQARPSRSAAMLQRALARPGASWFDLFPVSSREDRADWLRQIYRQSTSGQRTPPLPLPTARLHAICRDYTARIEAAYTYRFDSSRWSIGFSSSIDLNIFNVIRALPQPDSYFVVQGPFASGAATSRALLWRNGVETLVHESVDNSRQYTRAVYFGADPSGRLLTLGIHSDRLQHTTYRILDQTACGEGACPQWSVPGVPHWSPDGRYTLLLETSVETESATGAPRTVLYRADATGRSPVPLGVATAPFWLDEARYAFVRVDTSGRQELVTATAGVDRPRSWLNQDALITAVANAIPDQQAPQRLLVDAAAGADRGGEVAVLATESGGEGRRFVFHVRQSQVDDVWLLDNATNVSFSPDGQWLVVGRYDPYDPTPGTLYLWPLAGPRSWQLQTQLAYDRPGEWWTDDGAWVVQPMSGYFLVLAPAYDYRLLVPYDMVACDQVFWRQPPP